MSATILAFQDRLLHSMTDDICNLQAAIMEVIADEHADPIAVVHACIAIAVDHIASEEGVATLRDTFESYIGFWREDNPPQ